jgi:hypothetical protein
MLEKNNELPCGVVLVLLFFQSSALIATVRTDDGLKMHYEEKVLE